MSVGDTNGDSQMTSADLPPANGQIYTARSIILKPQPSLPSTNLVAGEVVYNDSDKKLYSYDGSAWAAVGGSAGSSGVTMMSARSTSTYTLANVSQYCFNLSATAAVAMNGDTTTTYTDWRLPSDAELAVFNGTTTDASTIWTGTTYAGYSVFMSLSTGNCSYSAWNAAHYARCVR